jgi:uncharacterized protein YbjT (DUF2867 family)
MGGSGLIGSKVVTKLRERGYEAIAASLNTGVNAVTGEGMGEVLKGAEVVVDVLNSPSFEENAVMAFFQASTSNILRYAAEAGVGHYVALSIVGTDRFPENQYFRAKIVQEKLIRESRRPYTIVRATQFFEFVAAIVDSATEGNIVRLPPVDFQPMAAEDVASAVAKAAMGEPVNGVVEVAGPELFRFDELIQLSLRARGDQREVVADQRAQYYGAIPGQHALVPAGEAQLGAIRFRDWLGPAAVRA